MKLPFDKMTEGLPPAKRVPDFQELRECQQKAIAGPIEDLCKSKV